MYYSNEANFDRPSNEQDQVSKYQQLQQSENLKVSALHALNGPFISLEVEYE